MSNQITIDSCVSPQSQSSQCCADASCQVMDPKILFRSAPTVRRTNCITRKGSLYEKTALPQQLLMFTTFACTDRNFSVTFHLFLGGAAPQRQTHSDTRSYTTQKHFFRILLAVASSSSTCSRFFCFYLLLHLLLLLLPTSKHSQHDGVYKSKRKKNFFLNHYFQGRPNEEHAHIYRTLYVCMY